MKDVVIINKGSPWLNTLAIVVLGLICAGLGYRLAGIPDCGLLESVQPSSPATAMEKWVALSIQKAKPGDYAILKDGQVLRLSGSSQMTVVDGDRVYYNTRMTVGGHFEKPLWQMASATVAVVNPTSLSYAVIDKCFYRGRVVTTVGPAKWTCT